MLIFCFIVSYFLVFRPAIDGIHAVKGTTPPRVEMARARMALKGGPADQPQRYGLGAYLRDWWHDSWEDARDVRSHRRALRLNGQKIGWRESARQLGSTMAREWRSLRNRPVTATAPDASGQTFRPVTGPTSPEPRHTQDETAPQENIRPSSPQPTADQATRPSVGCTWQESGQNGDANTEPCGIPQVSGTPYCPLHLNAWNRQQQRADAAEAKPPRDDTPADTPPEQEAAEEKQVNETPEDPKPPLATVTPIRTTQGDNTMPETETESVPSGEITSLRAAISYAAGQATACNDGVSSVDQSLGELANGGVTDEAALGAFTRAQERLGAAEDEFRSAKDALEAHLAVTEAYEANEGAGEKEFVTGE